MNPWGMLPFVRLIIPFILGIISGIKIFLGIVFTNSILLGLLIFTFLIIVFPGIFISYRSRWLFGTVAFVFLFLSGIKLTQTQSSKNNPYYFAQCNAKVDYYVADIKEPLSGKSKSYKTVLKLCYLMTNETWIPAKGNINTYFEKSVDTQGLHYGDRIIFKAYLNETKPPQNPNEFDYKTYLSLNDIYHQSYIRSAEFIVVENNTGNPIMVLAYRARQKLLESLNNGCLDKQSYAVAAALLLGYKDELDPDLRSAYSAAGAMHILCVSGLHVGVIFIVLSTMLGVLGRSKFSVILRSVFILITIWFYAFLTGLSPSVLRASCMISLIVVAGSLNRFVNIYNVLASSAFVLLMLDTYILFSVGFQLSYLAVIGIVSIYKHLNNIFSVNFFLFDKMWSICAVSMAAQLATFPLAVYYFHQFPNLFLITNLMVIPLSSLVIYSGMASFVFMSIGSLHDLFIGILSFLIGILNKSITMIDNIKFSSAKMLSLDNYEVLIIYLSLIFFTLYINLRKNKYLNICCIVIVAFLFLNIFQSYERSLQKLFYVYNIKGYSAYDFVSGNQNCLMADTSILSDRQQQDFHILGNWCKLGLKSPLKLDVEQNALSSERELRNIGLYKRNGFIFFNGLRILIVDKELDYVPINKKLKLDIIVIASNSALSIKELQETFIFSLVIIDSSNPRNRAEKLIRECEDLGIDCYSVLHDGAFICNLKM